jgi:hypothetical protein
MKNRWSFCLTVLLAVASAEARMDDDPAFRAPPASAAPATASTPGTWGDWFAAKVDSVADRIEAAGYVGVSDQLRDTKDRWLGPARTESQRQALRDDRDKSRQVKKMVQELPSYVTSDKGSTAAEVADRSRALRNQALWSGSEKTSTDVVVWKGPAAGAKGVESFPRLVVEREQRLTSRSFSWPTLRIERPEYRTLPALPPPDAYRESEYSRWSEFLTGFKDPQAPELNRKEFGLDRLITAESIRATLRDLKLSETRIDERPYAALEDADFKNLQAQILFEQKDKCHLAVGLLHPLTKGGRAEPDVHFRLGVCAHKMGFFNESIHRLVKVIRAGESPYLAEAIETLVADVPASAERDVAQALLMLKNQSLIPEKVRDQAFFLIAKGLAKSRQWDKSDFYARRVSETSDRKGHSLFVQSVAEYAQGRIEESLRTLDAARAWLKARGRADAQLESLVTMNRARILFQSKKFAEAGVEYLRVDKKHPLWIQALTEQAWAQLMMGDSAGSIGNMYSLHSPFFSHVYKPESYAVRAMGYLNICQFGDAYQTLQLMEQIYQPWSAKMKAFSGAGGDRAYATVRAYLAGRSDADVNGLPYQVIREMARQRNFINVQNEINRLEDERSQYGFIDELIKSESDKMAARRRAALERIENHRAQVRRAERDKSLAGQLNEWSAKIKLDQAFVRGHDVWIEVFRDSRAGYKAMRKESATRLQAHRAKLEAEAGKVLTQNLLAMRSAVDKLIDNNELLRYEVFSGSGENLRYQTAGGRVQGENRVPAHIKPAKTLSWSFSGEYWADEIGHYRSRLKNNCPEDKEMNTGYQGPKTAKSK